MAHRLFGAVVQEQILAVGLGIDHREALALQQFNIGRIHVADDVHRAGFQRDGAGRSVGDDDEIQILDIGRAAEVIRVRLEVITLVPDMLFEDIGAGAVDALDGLAQIVAILGDQVGVQNQSPVSGQRGQRQGVRAVADDFTGQVVNHADFLDPVHLAGVHQRMIGVQVALIGGLYVFRRKLFAADGEIDIIAQVERPHQAVLGNLPAFRQVGHNFLALQANQSAVYQTLIALVGGRDAGVQRFGILVDRDGQRVAILDFVGKRDRRQAADHDQRQDQGKHSLHVYPSIIF